MDLLDHYRAMATYNTWMNQKLYGVCAALPADERTRDRGAFFGSIHRTLNHILLADRRWLARLTGDSERYASRDASGAEIAVTALGQILYDDFADLRREREATDADIEAWIASLDASAPAAVMRYERGTGAYYEHPAWYAISHMFNHQTHHRGQVTTLLSQLDIDIGVTDLAAMLREPPPVPSGPPLA